MAKLLHLEFMGTKIHSLFQFKSAIIEDKITTWHVSPEAIKCSEVSTNCRLLFTYTLWANNLVNYQYNYTDPVVKLKFEIRWLFEQLQTLKIKNRISFTIYEEEPNLLYVQIFGSEKSIKKSAIRLTINPEVVIQSPPPDIYYDDPITMYADAFQPFLKVKTFQGKASKERLVMQVQAPNYISCSRLSKNETEEYGELDPADTYFKENFYIQDIKHVSKLVNMTSIFNIFQPVNHEKKPPLMIRGLCGDFGEWNVYIHCCDCVPVHKVEIEKTDV